MNKGHKLRKKGLRRVGTVAKISLLVVLVISLVATNVFETKRTYKKGFADGFSKGFADGFSNGKSSVPVFQVYDPEKRDWTPLLPHDKNDTKLYCDDSRIPVFLPCEVISGAEEANKSAQGLALRIIPITPPSYAPQPQQEQQPFNPLRQTFRLNF